MLSVADLIDATTLSAPLAAALAARVASGASFMIGAKPGGAGKTTVMCALLNFIPVNIDILPATQESVRQAAAATTRQCHCYVCHEIGSGHYYAYLWGDALRQYCGLGDCGHVLAANLHADTLEEAKAQVCGVNNIPDQHFRNFALLAFLRVSKPSRVVHQVYVSNAGEPHELAYDASSGLFKPDLFASSEKREACRVFLETFMAQPDRTIHAMRQSVLESPLLAGLWEE